MHIVITFLTTSKFYITSKNQRPVTSPSGKVGGARLTRFMVITLSKCKKKLRWPEGGGFPGNQTKPLDTPLTLRTIYQLCGIGGNG